MFSYFGIIALSGVVVNDSLILVDFINKERAMGVPLSQAVVDGARQRFRPILLTSLTTFLGLAPITIFEKSLQAQAVVPMAASLAFGIVFATVITLILIPSLYLILDDFKGFWGGLFRRLIPNKESARHPHPHAVRRSASATRARAVNERAASDPTPDPAGSGRTA
jgi:predicted RND superfamily exporter protein